MKHIYVFENQHIQFACSNLTLNGKICSLIHSPQQVVYLYFIYLHNYYVPHIVLRVEDTIVMEIGMQVVLMTLRYQCRVVYVHRGRGRDTKPEEHLNWSSKVYYQGSWFMTCWKNVVHFVLCSFHSLCLILSYFYKLGKLYHVSI